MLQAIGTQKKRIKMVKIVILQIFIAVQFLKEFRKQKMKSSPRASEERYFYEFSKRERELYII